MEGGEGSHQGIRNKEAKEQECVDRFPLLAFADPVHLDTNRTRLVRKAKPTESFFNFFTPPPPIEDESEIDEDELEEIEEKLEIDYQIGEDLKEKVRLFLTCSYLIVTPNIAMQIIPRAVDYFTGKALEYEALDDDDEDFEDLEDDDDEDGFDEVRSSLALCCSRSVN